MKTRVMIVGSKGRMGEALIRLAKANPDLEFVGGVDQGESLEPLAAKSDAIIDFSHHSVTLDVAQIAAKHNLALVVGTTGHSDDVKKSILDYGAKIPLIFSPNYSVGVNALFYLTRKAAEVLGESYDQEVVEMHHRFKKDAPSGTARRLVEILCEVKEKSYEELSRHGRVGEPGARTSSEIGVHALRGGDVVGDHTVVFATLGERVELTHKASTRETFASGALRAAHWLKGKKPGVYDMFDILGLK